MELICVRNLRNEDMCFNVGNCYKFSHEYGTLYSTKDEFNEIIFLDKYIIFNYFKFKINCKCEVEYGIK